MMQLGSDLDYIAVGFGLVVSALVLARQLFADDGVLSTGWNKRIRAVRVLRGRFPEFDSIYRGIDVYRLKEPWRLISAIATGVVPQLPVLAFIELPFLKNPSNVLIFVIGTGAGVWVTTLSIRDRVRTLETISRTLESRETTLLTRLRYLQGRLVMAWYLVPYETSIYAIPRILSSTSISAVETLILGVLVSIGFAILFGLATVESLSAFAGAAFNQYRNTTGAKPRVRVSVMETAGGKSTVTGTLLAIGTECVVRTDDNFEERLDWRHVGRLAVESPLDQSVAPPAATARDATEISKT